MLISSVSRPEHLDLFEAGIARRLDLAFAGPQSVRIAQLVEDGAVTIGAIHTYIELYARMFTDLTPDVALLCASKADRDGNLYTGPNTEDTPTIAEGLHPAVALLEYAGAALKAARPADRVGLALPRRALRSGRSISTPATSCSSKWQASPPP